MLDKLPKDVWKNPNLKWLDPANGIGNYPIVAYYKLMEGLKNVKGYENKDKLSIQKSLNNFKGKTLICHGSLDLAVHHENASNLLKWSSSSELYKIRTNHTFGAKHPWEKDSLPEDLNQLCIKTISFLNEE